MSNKELAMKRFGDAYYGEGAAVGDGKFLEMMLAFFTKFLGSCPLGVRRAHAMVNGPPFRQARARQTLEYAAYEWTSGDWEQTQKITEAGMKVGQQSTVQEFAEFAS